MTMHAIALIAIATSLAALIAAFARTWIRDSRDQRAHERRLAAWNWEMEQRAQLRARRRADIVWHQHTNPKRR